MLLMFRVKNFMSFKDESILDMRATSYKQHPSHVMPVEGTKGLLKAAVIYGANASGKSNFIAAMHFFVLFVGVQLPSVQSHFVDNHHVRDVFQLIKKPVPFLLTKSNENPSEFEIAFIRRGKHVQYGFECNDNEILSEWLYIDSKLVFERSEQVVLGGLYKKYLNGYTKVNKDGLYISTLQYFLDDHAKDAVILDLIIFTCYELRVFYQIYEGATVKINARPGKYGDYTEILEDDTLRAKVEKYLRIIDIELKGLDVETLTAIDEVTGELKETKMLLARRDIYDDNGNKVGEKHFDLSKESTGTQYFIAYIQEIIPVIENGGVFVCDEMTTSLHPLLAKLIVDIFTSSDNKKGQLIFTTHDVSLLNNSQFRRDEVFFVDKNHRGESKLYSLSDLKTREDASFSKDYLQGKYGAIPIFNYEDDPGGDADA